MELLKYLLWDGVHCLVEQLPSILLWDGVHYFTEQPQVEVSIMRQIA